MSKTIIDIAAFKPALAGLLTDPEGMRIKRTKEAQDHVKEGMTLHVGQNGLWWGSFPDVHTTDPTCKTSRSVQSYERVGFHSGSDYFLQAFLQAGGTVLFHGFKGIEGEVIL
jgi:hypothetical protein